MKIKYLSVTFLILIILCGLIFINRVNKKPFTYINAIDKVYNSNINGMSMGVAIANNFYRRDERVLLSEAANKEDNFSANSKGGVKLWEAKQLFLNIKNLKTLREGAPEILESDDTEYYLIITSHDYYGRDAKLDIHYLELYVNSKNYHIYMPEYYYDPDKLQNLSTVYVEYEPNEITKKLINDILAVN